MIRLSVNDFFVQHPEIPTRKDFSHRVVSSHSTDARKDFLPNKVSGTILNELFSLHLRRLLLVEWAHDAIHPSETTFVPISFYKRAYLNR
jgi:hypothetical protein